MGYFCVSVDLGTYRHLLLEASLGKALLVNPFQHMIFIIYKEEKAI